MKEYTKILEGYSQVHHSWMYKLVDETEWGNIDVATGYLTKYWLSDSEYESYWRDIQNAIFTNAVGLPGKIFNIDFETKVVKGGCLFTQQDFLRIQKCMLEAGDQNLIVVENLKGEVTNEQPFKFRFPVGISWEEITSGNFVSSVLLESVYKEFFVFGDTSLWGMYTASDYEFPLDVIGFRVEVQDCFLELFNPSEDEIAEIKKWIPPGY